MEITDEKKNTSLLSASQAFQLGSATAVKKVVDELDFQASKRIKVGFNQDTFTVGVLICFVILFIFDKYP